MALQLRRGTNAERLAITPAQGELIFVTDYLAVNITGNTIATNVITFSANHNITVLNTKLLYQGATQNGLTQGTVYYVKSIPAVNQLTLSTTSGGTTTTLTNGTSLTLTFNKSPTNASGTPVGNVSPLWIGNGTTVGGVSAQVSILDDLLDVTLTSLQEGQTFYYDATSSQWKNTSILTIDDTTNSTNIIINSKDKNLINNTNTNTDLMSSSIEARSITTAVPLSGFGSSINFSANNTANDIKQLGTVGFAYNDLTATNEDAEFIVKMLKAGVTPLSPESNFTHQFRVDSEGNILTAKHLTLNKDRESTTSSIFFNHPTTDGSIQWQGTAHFLSGDLVVNGGSDNQVVIDTPAGGTGIANIYNGVIGTINMGNGVTTELNLGNSATGTRTQIKSPNVDLLGDIKIGGNDIKSSTGAVAITLSGSDVTVAGELKVTGNKIKSSNADALTFSSSDVTVVGDLIVGGNDIKHSSGTTQMTLASGGVVFSGDIQVNGNDIKSSTGSTAITLDNNSIVVAGDATVEGGNINLNGTTPFLTFATQADGVNTMYGIRGKSTIDDGWFIGSGSTGDDLGYLEIATGDNAGGTNTGGQIYVRQYNNGATSPLGVPWEGGTGTVVNTLTLLDNLGNTQVPKLLTVGGGISVTNGYITTPSSSVSLFSDGGQPTTIDFGATASALSMGHISGTGTTTVRNNLTVSGNLTVNGTTTTVNSTTVTVDDKNIELGSVATPTDVTASGGGITLKGATDKTIIWNNDLDGFEINQAVKTTGRLNVNEKIFLYANTGDIRTSGDAYIGGYRIILREAQTGVPNSTNTSSIIVERGSSADASLTFYEDTDTWLTSNNARIAENFTVSGNTTLGYDSNNTITMNGLVGGNISFTYNDTSTPRGILGKTSTGADDFWFVGGAEINGTSDSGYAMIATGNDANEPIYVRQYTGSPLSGTVSKQLTLLDASGNTTIPNILTVSGGTALTPSINTTGSISIGKDIYSYGDTGIFLNGSTVVFNNNTSGSPTKDAEITVARGSSANVKLRWYESTDRWQFTNDGTTYTNMPVATDKPTYAGLNVTSSIDSTSGALQLGTLSNNPIKLTPNGTGNVFLEATTVQIGESTGAQLTTGGSDLRLDTDNSNNSGYITIAAGVNGAITLSPNGTGVTNITSNLTVTGNLTVNGTTTTINSTTVTVDDKNIELGSVTTPTDTTASGGGVTLKGATDKTIIWNNATDGWEFNQPVKVTGAGVFSGNVAVNGGSLTTTATTANLFTTNATTLNVGSSATTVNYTGLVTHSSVITDLAATTTLTQNIAHNLTSTTRRGMKLLINITDNVTKDVHIVEVLLVTKVVGGVGTVYMTTFGEVTSAGQLATFSADSNGTTTYFYVTPVSTNSTTFAYSRRSI